MELWRWSWFNNWRPVKVWSGRSFSVREEIMILSSQTELATQRHGKVIKNKIQNISKHHITPWNISYPLKIGPFGPKRERRKSSNGSREVPWLSGRFFRFWGRVKFKRSMGLRRRWHEQVRLEPPRCRGHRHENDHGHRHHALRREGSLQGVKKLARKMQDLADLAIPWSTQPHVKLQQLQMLQPLGSFAFVSSRTVKNWNLKFSSDCCFGSVLDRAPKSTEARNQPRNWKIK